MNSSQLVQGLSGWAIGYSYSEEKIKEDEIQQGANYYLSTLNQTTQFIYLSNVVYNINQLLPKYLFKLPVNIACQLSFSSIVPFILAATVKQGSYPSIAPLYNGLVSSARKKWIPLPKLPEKLSGSAIKTISFISRHSGDMIRIAMIASSLAIMRLGNRAFGAATLTAISYQVIDQLGYIPRKISLFIETYLPTIALMGMVSQGLIFTRILSAIQLSTHLSSPVNRYIQHKIDFIVRRLWNASVLYLATLAKPDDKVIQKALIKGPSLMKIDRPLTQRKALNFDQISFVLDNDFKYFEINSSHYNHTFTETVIEANYEFDHYVELFNSIDWSKKSSLIMKNLKGDDRFIEWLEENFVCLKQPEYRDKSDRLLDSFLNSHMNQLAQKYHMSTEEYCVNWFKKQFAIFISAVKGDHRVKGSQKDLDEAIHDFAKILSYLQSIKEKQKFCFEDALMKITVEGGDYCARGLKRVAFEISQQINLEKSLGDEDNQDPIKGFELQIQQALQNKRKMLLDKHYQKLVEKAPKQITQDVHTYDLFRSYLSLGFYPLTKHERDSFDLSKLLVWEIYHSIRNDMYEEYIRDLNDVIDESIENIGEVNFGIYIQQLINNNQSLSDAEKEAIIEIYTERNNNKWTMKQTEQKFRQLMLFQLGILTVKKI